MLSECMYCRNSSVPINSSECLLNFLPQDVFEELSAGFDEDFATNASHSVEAIINAGKVTFFLVFTSLSMDTEVKFTGVN